MERLFSYKWSLAIAAAHHGLQETHVAGATQPLDFALAPSHNTSRPDDKHYDLRRQTPAIPQQDIGSQTLSDTQLQTRVSNPPSHIMFGRSKSYGSRSSHSPSRSSVVSRGEGKGYYTRPSASKSSTSLFGSNEHHSSSRGIFSSSGSSSYYKRRPRDGYISYLMHRLSRMIKELWYYARRHPVKAFFAVVVPLLSAGGAVHGLLRQFNIRIPGLDGAMRRGGGGYYGSSGYGGGSSSLGGLGDLAGASGLMGNAGSLMQIARAFM